MKSGGRRKPPVLMIHGAFCGPWSLDGRRIRALPVDSHLPVMEIGLAWPAAALAQLRGPIMQVPPMYSALKRDGKPLYEYARAGITLEREARNVIIHQLELMLL